MNKKALDFITMGAMGAAMGTGCYYMSSGLVHHGSTPNHYKPDGSSKVKKGWKYYEDENGNICKRRIK